MDSEKPNAYYTRTYEYNPHTKALGEHVRGDFTSIEGGFAKLPPPNGSGTGFTDDFIVQYPVQPQSPVPYSLLQRWPTDVSANNHYLKELLTPSDEDRSAAANVDYVLNKIVEISDPNAVPDGGILLNYHAEGGETAINTGYVFSRATVYINGKFKHNGIDFVVEDSLVRLENPLSEGDLVGLILGVVEPERLDQLLVRSVNGIKPLSNAQGDVILTPGDIGLGDLPATVSDAINENNSNQLATSRAVWQINEKKLGRNEKALSAGKWDLPRTLILQGGGEGGVTFDGSADIKLTVTIKNDSHRHTLPYVDGLKTALDKKAPQHDHPYRLETWLPAWEEVSGKPLAFPPEAHVHSVSDLPGLEEDFVSIAAAVDRIKGVKNLISTQTVMIQHYAFQ